MRIAIVGGTGPFGRALAGRLHEAGFEVVIGSRDADRATRLAAEFGVEGAANPPRGAFDWLTPHAEEEQQRRREPTVDGHTSTGHGRQLNSNGT